MRHLYIHVPFCRRRCTYCDFQIAVRTSVPARAFVRDVLAERDIRGLTFADPLDTLYLGGGTPSLLPGDQLRSLVAAFPLAPSAEVTLEANPEDVTAEAAEAWLDAGINRVSLGVQTFDADVLTWMHRPHGPEAPGQAVRRLRAAGLRRLSVDLIFAVPERFGRDLHDDLDRLLALGPDHVSAYGLTIEPRTPLGRWVRDGREAPAPEEDYEAEFLATHATLGEAGFEHYEVSNYALPDARARHNAAYWSGAPWAALGPGAHAFDGRVRRWNLGPLAAWERAVRAGRDPIDGSEVPDAEAAALERVYLGLRTSDGLPADARLDPAAVAAAVSAGWLERRGDRLLATPTGWLRLDALVPRLTTSAGGG